MNFDISIKNTTKINLKQLKQMWSCGAYILSSRSVALSKGRYTWQHEKILSVLADSLEKARKRPPPKNKRFKFIHFVRAGETEKSG